MFGFRCQAIEIQRTCDHGEPAVRGARPLFGRAVPVKFDAVAIRVAEIKCLAHAVIRGAFERNARAAEAEKRIRQIGACGVKNR